jgi:hypothetical protein
VTAVLDIPVAVRCEALFVSDLQRSDHPTGEAVREAVCAVVDRLGEAGCAAAVAEEYGDHPDCACERMQWARQAVREAFA